MTNALAMLRLLPMGDHDEDVEILALRHQITVLERQLHGEKPQFTLADRSLLAALLYRLPREVLHRIRVDRWRVMLVRGISYWFLLLVVPVLRWLVPFSVIGSRNCRSRMDHT